MFSVKHKVSNSINIVYDITYDIISGEPKFLIYENNQWVKVSAKQYAPYDPGYKGATKKKILNEG